MALNKEYFDAIDIGIVKHKYYNANKVQVVLEDIQKQAEELYSENAKMKEQLEAYGASRLKISEAVISAQGMYKEIIAKAEAQAAKIISQAEQKRDEMLGHAQAQQETSALYAEKFYTQMHQHYQDGLEQLNGQWQEYLSGLYTDEELDEDERDEDEQDEPETQVPGDLTKKVDAIAKELFSI